MMSAENLIRAYKNNEPEQITRSKEFSIMYWSDNSSSSDDRSSSRDNKLDSNIKKYIKKKNSKKRNVKK